MSDNMETLKNFNESLTLSSKSIEYLYRDLCNLKSSIIWLLNEIKTIEENKGRKSKTAHISTLKNQVRQKEIEYAFKKRDWDNSHSFRRDWYKGMEENYLFSEDEK